MISSEVHRYKVFHWNPTEPIQTAFVLFTLCRILKQKMKKKNEKDWQVEQKHSETFVWAIYNHLYTDVNKHILSCSYSSCIYKKNLNFILFIDLFYNDWQEFHNLYSCWYKCSYLSLAWMLARGGHNWCGRSTQRKPTCPGCKLRLSSHWFTAGTGRYKMFHQKVVCVRYLL